MFGTRVSVAKQLPENNEDGEIYWLVAQRELLLWDDV